MEMIDIAPHKAHGSQADRERAKERAQQRYARRRGGYIFELLR